MAEKKINAVTEGTAFNNDTDFIIGYNNSAPEKIKRFKKEAMNVADKDVLNKNGFDLYTPESLPDITYNYSTRTISLSVKSGSSNFYFWVNNKKIIKTTTQTVTIPDTTGGYYIYFNNDGILQYTSATPLGEVFYSYAIVSYVYYNVDFPNEALFNPNELHGKDMSGATHQSIHETVGARVSYGGKRQGFSEGSTTYSTVTECKIWDEDIPHVLPASSTHERLYKWGSNGAWRRFGADNQFAYKESGDTYYSYNYFDGTNWGWKEGGTSDDYWIEFEIATPMGIMKISGENGYSNKNKARNAIYTELNKITTDGLPNPEFAWLRAYIVKRDGSLIAMDDGSLYLDLVGTKGAGSGNTGVVTAGDVVTDTTNFGGALSNADDNVQKALETLDDAVGSNSDDVLLNSSRIQTNSDNILTNSDNILTNSDNISTNTNSISNNSDDIQGVQDDKADKSNVLELNNTTVFTPDNDYEPATKKFVEDTVASGGAISGTYTPTLSDTSNVASASSNVAMYTRIGDFVDVDVNISVDASTSGTYTYLSLSLPIASSFTNANNDVIGVVSSYYGKGYVLAKTTTNMIRVVLKPDDTNSRPYNIHVRYIVK